jgi:YD repeat-containing protein
LDALDNFWLKHAGPELERMVCETVTYSYDALGRVVSVSHAGGDNNGMTNSLSYDAAGNRTNYTVIGSKDRGLGGGGVVVVPLNGFTIIPIG